MYFYLRVLWTEGMSFGMNVMLLMLMLMLMFVMLDGELKHC